MKTCLRLTCVAMIALATATAQPQTFPPASRGVPVRGEITSTSSLAGSLTVELASNGTEVSETANVNGDGTFEFRSASPGTHWLRVVAGNSVIYEEVVNISRPRTDSLDSPQRSVQRQPFCRNQYLHAATHT